MPNYRLLRRIGRGSFGEVWLAIDAMNKWAAIKVVWWNEEDDGRSYQREFAGLKRYDDLSVGDGWLMPIKNVSCDPERRFFSYAMDLADDARTLAPLQRIEGDDPAEAARRAEGYQPRILCGELRRRGRLDPREAAEIGAALCQSLERLHAGKLLHRDIKPSNIIFVGGQPKLADIGLVAAMDATLVSLAGTSGFVPLVGAGTASGDIFALGKVIYLMATGNRVEDFPKESAAFPELPDDERGRLAELQAVYDRACDPDPQERQPTARALREELELLRENASVRHLRELENRERARGIRWRRWKIACAIGAPVAAASLGFLALWIRQQSILHHALVGELERRQLVRVKDRQLGWSRVDWDSAQSVVAAGRSDSSVIRQAVGTLSGLDADPLASWPEMEATDAAFSPDGRVVLAGFGRSPAWLITNKTNRQQLPVSGEGKVAWNSDGVPLILQPGANSFLIHNLLTGEIEARLSAPKLAGALSSNSTPAMALSSDGRWAAAQIENETSPWVAVWNAESGERMGEKSLAAACLKISPDNQYLAVGHPYGRGSVLRMPHLEMLMSLPAVLGNNAVQALAFGRNLTVRLPDGRTEFPWRLATGTHGAGIAVWDLALPAPIAFCRGSTWEVQALAFSPDGITLASSGRNGIRLWDGLTGRVLLSTESPWSNTRALAFDDSGQFLLAGSTSESSPAETSLFELEPHRGILSLRGLTTVIRKTAWSPDGRWMAALSDEWKLAVWDTTTGQLIWRFAIPPDDYADSVGMAFSPDGSRLAVASGADVRTMLLDTGEWENHWPLAMGFGKEIRFRGNDRLRLALVETDQERIRPRQWAVYEFAKGQPPHLIQRQQPADPETMNVLATPDGERLLVMAWDASREFNHVRYIDLTTGEVVWARKSQGPDLWTIMRMDPQGRWCGYRTRNVPNDNLTEVLSLADGQPIALLPGDVRLAALSPERSWYVTPRAHPNSLASTLMLQQMGAADQALPLGTDGHLTVDTVAFSPDGRRLAWASDDCAVAIAEVDQVRRAVGQFLKSEPLPRLIQLIQ